jgi:dTDP-4-dehydrorhamnose reductase
VTVWVTGAAGMLGQEVVRELEALEGVTVIATDREVDITDPAAVDAHWAEHGPFEWTVNCAAWTAVDAAEENEEAAKRLNVEGPRVLAATAATHGAAILHISTDYVFSGEGERPYAPDDPTDPRSAYGRTKATGEEAVRSANPHHVIIRTAWLYGPGGKNFVYTMLRLMAEREEIGVVVDQYGVPTFAPDLARVIASVTGGEGGRSDHGNDHRSWGTFHYTNAAEDDRGISWFDFAEAIYSAGRAAALITTNCRINALTTAEYPTPAARPAYSVLDSSETVRVFGVEQPAWRASLDRFLQSVSQKGNLQS